VAKVGLTKSARYVPVVGVVLFLLCMAAFSEGGPLAAYLPDFLTWLFTDETAFIYLMIGAAIAVLILYAISLMIAIKLYEHREF